MTRLKAIENSQKKRLFRLIFLQEERCWQQRAKTSAQLAQLALQVVLQANLADQIDLGFQKIDVFFGVVENALQQVARNIVSNTFAMRHAHP